MFKFILLMCKLILLPLSKTKQELLLEIIAARAEVALLKRKLNGGKKKLKFSKAVKLFYALLAVLSKKFKSMLIKPETILKWYHNFLKRRWEYKHKKPVGRPATPNDTKQLVLKMKNENISWGNKKIQGELLKLGIELDKNTIARIIAHFRKQGKVKTGLSWKKFIQSHIDTLHAMDYFAVDTLFGKTYYVFFIIYLKTREIVQMRITDVPSHRFVRQQLLGWWEGKEQEKVHLIHDHDPTFLHIDYQSLGIENTPTSIAAPNMNAYAERFVRSVRKEALDWFVLFNYNQMENILKEYVRFYNKQRPHQGINQQVPAGHETQAEGRVISFPVLSGLHHYYERRVS